MTVVGPWGNMKSSAPLDEYLGSLVGPHLLDRRYRHIPILKWRSLGAHWLAWGWSTPILILILSPGHPGWTVSVSTTWEDLLLALPSDGVDSGLDEWMGSLFLTLISSLWSWASTRAPWTGFGHSTEGVTNGWVERFHLRYLSQDSGPPPENHVDILAWLVLDPQLEQGAPITHDIYRGKTGAHWQWRIFMLCWRRPLWISGFSNCWVSVLFVLHDHGRSCDPWLNSCGW